MRSLADIISDCDFRELLRKYWWNVFMRGGINNELEHQKNIQLLRFRQASAVLARLRDIASSVALSFSSSFRLHSELHSLQSGCFFPPKEVVILVRSVSLPFLPSIDDHKTSLNQLAEGICRGVSAARFTAAAGFPADSTLDCRFCLFSWLLPPLAAPLAATRGKLSA